MVISSKFGIGDTAIVEWVNGLDREVYSRYVSGKSQIISPIEMSYMSMIGSTVRIVGIKYCNIGLGSEFKYIACLNGLFVETIFEENELKPVDVKPNTSVVDVDRKYGIGQYVYVEYSNDFETISGEAQVLGFDITIRNNFASIDYLVSMYDQYGRFETYIPESSLSLME